MGSLVKFYKIMPTCQFHVLSVLGWFSSGVPLYKEYALEGMAQICQFHEIQQFQ